MKKTHRCKARVPISHQSGGKQIENIQISRGLRLNSPIYAGPSECWEKSTIIQTSTSKGVKLKVLLLGEFSGLHKNLKEGLVELGHDVTIASSGDGWKSIKSDLNIGPSRKGILRKPSGLWNIFRAVLKLKGYDVVQIVSPAVFPRIFGINKAILRYIFNANKKIFLVGAGCNDSGTADFFENGLKYPQLYREIKKSNPEMWIQCKKGRKFNHWILQKINGFIPIMYEYAEGYRRIGYEKLCPTIPIPINTDLIQYTQNKVGEKLVVFHGLNREGVKGTPIIRKAMELLQNEFPDDVECIIDGKIPLHEYLSMLEKVNVVVDQAYSVSVGVNGVYNLAMGKVVVGGGEVEFLEEFGLDHSPLIPIEPTVEDIYQKLKSLIGCNEYVEELGVRSRNFAENVHDYKKVAQSYVDVWSAN